MPGKARHSKSRHTSRSKRRRSGQGSVATPVQQLADSDTYRSVSKPQVSPPSPGAITRAATAAPVSSPYIIAEMRRIGILAGITLVILVVLALVLS